ncbi:MAG: Smr/MutS family protein [Acidobacteria bacterium]|nr:Smr/MutS family protein [Acidobacteriota bacterium]
MARREPPPDAGDAEAWARATAGVTPPRAAAERALPARRPPRPTAEDRREPEDAGPAPDAFEWTIEGEEVRGRAPDAPYALLKALGRGEPAPQARLDLHGFTRETALRELGAFVVRSRGAGVRSLLVITGRGEVLRRGVAEWLARSPAAAHLLAFCTAPPRLGGPGAVLVLLRRSGRRPA